MRMEQPTAIVEPAPGAVVAVFVTTQLHPVSLVIVELLNVMLPVSNIALRSEDIGSCEMVRKFAGCQFSRQWGECYGRWQGSGSLALP